MGVVVQEYAALERSEFLCGLCVVCVWGWWVGEDGGCGGVRACLVLTLLSRSTHGCKTEVDAIRRSAGMRPTSRLTVVLEGVHDVRRRQTERARERCMHSAGRGLSILKSNQTTDRPTNRSSPCWRRRGRGGARG